MHIGIAGVGRMGSAIGLRLMECGHSLTVWNRSPRQAQAACGGRGACRVHAGGACRRGRDRDHDPHQCRGHRHRVPRCGWTPVGRCVREAVHRDEHGAAGNRRQTRGDDQGQGRGAGGMSGRRQHRAGAPGQAARPDGRGRADAARAKPILDHLCRRVQHGGPVGSGAILKFAVNLPLMIYWQALGEALTLCKTLDIDPANCSTCSPIPPGAANVLPCGRIWWPPR